MNKKRKILNEQILEEGTTLNLIDSDLPHSLIEELGLDQLTITDQLIPDELINNAPDAESEDEDI